MAKYVYPAIFTKEENGCYSIVFPDLEACYTTGDSLVDGIYMAEDVLAFALYSLEKRHLEIPKPSEIRDVDDNSFVNLIACDTLEYQKMNNNKAINEPGVCLHYGMSATVKETDEGKEEMKSVTEQWFEEGIKQGKMQVVIMLYKKGNISLDVATEELGVSKEEFLEMVSKDEQEGLV